jgi:hypothetical protein
MPRIVRRNINGLRQAQQQQCVKLVSNIGYNAEMGKF